MDDEISQVAEQRFEVGDSVVVLAFWRNGIVTGKSLADPLRYEVRVDGGSYMRDLEARDLLGTCDKANRTLQLWGGTMGITTRILRSCRPLGPCAGEPMASSVPQRLSSRRSFRSALANSNTNPEAALKLERLGTIEPFYDRRSS